MLRYFKTLLFLVSVFFVTALMSSEGLASCTTTENSDVVCTTSDTQSSPPGTVPEQQAENPDAITNNGFVTITPDTSFSSDDSSTITGGAVPYYNTTGVETIVPQINELIHEAITTLRNTGAGIQGAYLRILSSLDYSDDDILRTLRRLNTVFKEIGESLKDPCKVELDAVQKQTLDNAISNELAGRSIDQIMNANGQIKGDLKKKIDDLIKEACKAAEDKKKEEERLAKEEEERKKKEEEEKKKQEEEEKKKEEEQQQGKNNPLKDLLGNTGNTNGRNFSNSGNNAFNGTPGSFNPNVKGEGGEKIANCAEEAYKQKMSTKAPGTNNGRLGCALAVSKILDCAGYGVGTHLSTVALYQALEKNPCYEKVDVGVITSTEAAGLKPGDVLVTQRGSRAGHAGVIGADGRTVIHNSSSQGAVAHKDSISSWNMKIISRNQSGSAVFRRTCGTGGGEKAKEGELSPDEQGFGSGTKPDVNKSLKDSGLPVNDF